MALSANTCILYGLDKNQNKKQTKKQNTRAAHTQAGRPAGTDTHTIRQAVGMHAKSKPLTLNPLTIAKTHAKTRPQRQNDTFAVTKAFFFTLKK